jgi:hypothetical protein
LYLEINLLSVGCCTDVVMAYRSQKSSAGGLSKSPYGFNNINTGLIQAYNTYYTKTFDACHGPYNALNTDNTYHIMKPLYSFI